MIYVLLPYVANKQSAGMRGAISKRLILIWSPQRSLCVGRIARRNISGGPKNEGIKDLGGFDRVNESQKAKPIIIKGTKLRSDESPFDKVEDKNVRTPGGSISEHAFPVNPFYPRIATNPTEENKKSEEETRKSFLRTGSMYLMFGGTITLLALVCYYEVVYRNPEKHMIPFAIYSSPSHKEYLEINHVVFLDVAVDGNLLGRVHIGLFDKEAPIYCENFHRLATGNNTEGKTLKGTLFWKSTGTCLYGGDLKGVDGKDGVVAIKDVPYLPEDKHNNITIPFGCYAAGGFINHMRNTNDSNFMIFMDEGRVAVKGDFTCFGMVLKGYNVVEQLSRLPREPFPYFVDRVEVVDSGLSPLDGNSAAIDMTLKRFHKARIQRYLATQPFHKKANEEALVDKQRQDKMRAKKEQVMAELEMAKDTIESSK